MISIRNFIEADYETVRGWWVKKAPGDAPPKARLLEANTYVAFDELEPLAALSVYLGASREFAICEDLIANPDIHKGLRRDAVTALWEFAQNLCRALKYRQIFAFTKHEGLALRYEELGLTRQKDPLISLTKQL